jgi:hypothetical protein
MKEKIVSLAILSLLLLSIIGVFTARALPANSMWIEPTNLTFTTASPVGTEFNVTVWLNVSSPTNSWQLYLVYDNSTLNATACVYSGPGNLKSVWSGVSPVDTVSPGFGGHNQTRAYVVFSEVLKTGAVKTGFGSVAIVTFKIMKAPAEGEVLTSELRLDMIGVFTSLALDADFGSIPLLFGNAFYSYSAPFTPPPPAKIFVNPPSVIDRALTPCHNFTVSVEISEATNVSLFSFRLSFNSTLLNATEVTLGSFFPGSATHTIEINNTVGYVTVFASLPPEELTKNGAGTLATMKFHVKDLGFSLLHLSDVQIKDKKSRILPLKPLEDGYFSNTALRGDVNGDGKVDVQDIAVAEKAFGSSAGPPANPRWNPAADMNQDGRIDVFDIAVICKNFGQHG